MGFIYSQLFVTPTYPTTSCAGQTIIVTGSNTGLGKEAARHFVRLGAAKVILAVRNTAAGEKAKEDILGSNTKVKSSNVVEVWHLDHADYASVKAFADRATTELERIDVLLLNAGVADDKFLSSNGHERMVDINVISTFYLAFLILPRLQATAKRFGIRPRLTVVTSEVHGFSKFPERNESSIFAALQNPDAKNMSERYPTSKLLEVLVVREIAPKLHGVTLNMLNPGLCHSELSRDSGMMLEVIKFFLARSTEVGSRTLVAGAMAGEESHGTYMSDGIVADEHLSPFVRSEEGKKAQEKVWTELKGVLEGMEEGVTEGLRCMTEGSGNGTDAGLYASTGISYAS
ncbi:hypothetical protein LTR37_001557 [Vermiconidia calcicola]|uniref:Uncharacterized protein n=1 Tax=Vermiconidia calcicola TaxID=1690605 RepID=A0ACC3NVJ4_9PEZI|nr:hypothetical protein LTR37_001557 [Vermiconidia calcicola]